jgi:hypothetical protein
MDSSDGSLTQSVLTFARHLAAMPEAALTDAWPAPSEPGGCWYGYDDNVREVVMNTYLELRQLAAEIESHRPPATIAQHALAQHQLAYRDLTGALAGVRDDEFDLVPAENEWPLRTVLYHIQLTERGFHALIHWAVRRQREGNTLPIEMPDDFRDEVSDRVDDTGSLDAVLARYDALHQRVLSDFVFLSDADLGAPNIWWEGYEIPARFRLHRFDAHLREHTIQVDKTLAGINHPPSEPERLARLIHQALGQVEGALLGASEAASEHRAAVRASVDATSTSLASMRPSTRPS